MRSRFLSIFDQGSFKTQQSKKNLSMSKERKELIVSFVAAIVLGYILTTILHSQNDYEAKERTPLHFATLCDPYVRIALLRFARSTQRNTYEQIFVL